jgi:alanine-glyoxylate transaminase/serine-glyoxylate transaminase/serine-pyruvate transaminase
MIARSHDEPAVSPGADERPMRLMIPGPVPLSPACAAALARPVEAHYGPAWAAVHHETVELLRGAFGTASDDVLLVVGSGTTGLDAAIGSVIDSDQTTIIGVNGTFGERLAAIARGHGARVVEVAAAWGEPIDPAAIDEALRNEPDARSVIVTHVETSTGVVNPIADLAGIAHRHGALILVDAVASVGGMEVAMDRLGIDVCVTASQKSLGGPVGLSPVAVSASAWPTIERRRAPRGFYLDLRNWRDYAIREAAWHPTPVSMPTNAVRALRQGLIELNDEGLSVREARFRRLAARFRAGLVTLGLTPLADERWAAPGVTAVRSVPGVDSAEIVRDMERSHGIRIAGGPPGPLAGSVFRVGHLGPGTSESDIDAVLQALTVVLATAGEQGPGATAPVVAEAR